MTENSKADEKTPNRRDTDIASHSFFDQLRRREVFKAAGIYAGGAWLLTEILLAVLDRSPFSQSVRALAGCVIVSVFISGFPLAVILAWFFDLTHRGIRRERVHSRGNPLTATIGLSAVVIGAGILMWRVNPCGLGRVLGVAVLPCSYYGAEQYEYQGPAISAELNYRLSHLPQLRVPAWPSTASLATKIAEPEKLAETLSVDRLVECGMRRSDTRASFNLQLYDPEADRNLWANEYEGQASDALLLIAEAFRDLIGVDGLNVSARAGGRIERVNQAPTASSEAWNLFQQGRLAEAEGRFEDALAFYREAAGHDPEFARAHAGLARMHWRAASRDGLPESERRARLGAAWAHAQRALTQAPKLAEALAIRRVLLAGGIGSPDKSDSPVSATDQQALHDQIIGLRPNYADEYLWWSQWLDSQGQTREAAAALETAQRLDPAGIIVHR